MSWSFSLFKIRGIPVRIHCLFPLLVLFLLLAQGPESGFQARLLLLVKLGILFSLILVHELGHSLAARRHGIRVVDIILWPLGGIARLAGTIPNPLTEFKVAAAGPACNLVLGLFILPFLHFSPFSSLRTNEFSLKTFASWFCIFNLFIGLFNLFPAFPMDGGRMLRALLALRVPMLQATAWAARAGSVLALLLVLTGIVFGILPATKARGFYLSLFVIAGFIFFKGRDEERRIRGSGGDAVD